MVGALEPASARVRGGARGVRVQAAYDGGARGDRPGASGLRGMDGWRGVVAVDDRRGLAEGGAALGITVRRGRGIAGRGRRERVLRCVTRGADRGERELAGLPEGEQGIEAAEQARQGGQNQGVQGHQHAALGGAPGGFQAHVGEEAGKRMGREGGAFCFHVWDYT